MREGEVWELRKPRSKRKPRSQEAKDVKEIKDVKDIKERAKKLRKNAFFAFSRSLLLFPVLSRRSSPSYVFPSRFVSSRFVSLFYF